MKKMKKNGLLNASEFASLANVSRQTLIFYDKKNILNPVYKDEKGYRYYNLNQIDIIVTIQALQTIGLSLQEIRNYLLQRTSDSTLQLFKNQMEKLNHQKSKLDHTIITMKSKCEVIEQALHVFTGMVYVEYHPKSYIVSSQDIDFNVDIDEDYGTLAEHLKFRKDNNFHCGRVVGGYSYLKRTYLEKKEKTSYKNYYTILNDFDISTYPKNYQVIQDGSFLVVYHKGNYIETYKSYELLFDYAQKNNLILDDYAYEESLIDEVSEAHIDNYVTQISVRFYK